MSHSHGTGLAGWREFLKTEVSQLVSQAKGKSLSRDFFELIRSIGEAKSKQEEDLLMRVECKKLQEEMKTPNPARAKEQLIRMMYLELFGVSAEFGYINAVNMTQSRDTVEKRVGYLAVCTLLHPGSELLMLVVNSIQKDLQKDNILEISAALTCICRLMSREFIPAVESYVVTLLGHSNPLVKKKAVMAFHRFVTLDPSLLARYEDKLRNALCDADPSVMSAAVSVFEEAAAVNRKESVDLVPSFVSILKQVIEGRLSKEYSYHRIPAPWIQIKILRVLALLGKGDRKASEHMYSALFDAIKRGDAGINAGYAVVYEAIRTVSQIYPNPQLLDSAATAISRFLSSNNHNLKYLGITALGLLVGVNPKYAAEHRIMVVECLSDPDETLKRKTLDLLFKMTNVKNVVFIVSKLVKSLRSTTDPYLRQELVSRITELAERFSPNNEWFIKTLNTIFLVSGELVRPEVAHNLMQLIALGTGDDEEATNDLRAYAVSAYMKLLDYRVLRDRLVQVIAWTLGEYGFMSGKQELIIEKLCELVDRQYKQSETRGFIVTALLKLCAQVGNGFYPPHVREVIEKYKSSSSVDLQQRCYEFSAIVQQGGLMQELLPADAFDEDLEVDREMHFLDGFVAQAVAQGAKRYTPPAERTFDQVSGITSQTFRFEAYEAPSKEAGGIMMSPDVYSQPIPDVKKRSTKEEGGLFNTKKSLWTEEGYMPEVEASKQQEMMRRPAPKKATTSASRNSRSSGSSAAEGGPQMDEREREAQELMMGLDGGSSSKKSHKKKKKKKKKERRPTSKAQATTESLLGGFDAPQQAPQPVQQQPPPQQQSLLGDLFGGPAPTSASPSPSATPPTSNNLADLFGGLSTSSTAAPAQQQQPAPQQRAASPLDFLSTGGGGGGLGGAALAPVRQGNFPSWQALGSLDALAQLPLPLAVNHDVGSAPMGQLRVVGEDDSLHAAVNKAFLPDATVVLLYVSNKSTSGPVNKVQLTFKVPDAFTSQVVADAGIESSEGGVTISQIPAGCTAIVRLRLRWKKHNAQLTLQTNVRYEDAAGSSRGTTFAVPLAVSDVLRPQQMPAEQFQATWAEHTQERKGQITGGVTAQQVEASAKERFNAHVVSRSQDSVALAAKLMGQDKLLLMQFDSQFGPLSFSLKTNDKFFSDVVSRYVQQQQWQ